VALDESYDYKVDPARPVAPGDVVRVPLGPKDRTGIVWDDPINESLDEARLKPVIERYDVPPLPAGLRKFIDWVARYTVSPRGQVLRMSLATPDLFREPPRQKAYELTGVEPERMTGARERVMETLRAGPPRAQGDLAEAAGVSPSVIKGLEDQGVVRALFLPSPERRSYEPPRPDLQGPSLSKGQAAAAAVLRESVAQGGYETTVLEGVTGSGKTEVYFEAVAEALRAAEDSQVLVLVPEIALTGQLLSRFEKRFGAAPVAWHSDMTPAERRRAWHGVRSGAARVVVGARSALFLPFTGLRLIVVDEEHDSSYKQEDGVLYHARDMAVVRATMEECAAILSSATPSLETLVNVWEGKYAHVHLPERHGGATLPEIRTIDMRAADIEPRRWLSGPMVRAMGATLEAGEQVLLFLNRRGYAPAAICRACGHRLEHEACSTPLVVHQYGNRLRCHHCAYAIPMPHACPECGEEEAIRAWGPGVERLEEEVNSRFPDKTVGLMTSDTISSAARAEDFIARIIENEFDVVIGTQLVTKGHHFPMLTLVGIVDGDMGLSSGDLRAAERTYQQLWQVSGRAGRAA
ncbi:MAG: primosomal protein N', partial [Alphaproteobacteria bacterium]|nr:primosomal protein N' [Alphaproteobacteria bacterium]